MKKLKIKSLKNHFRYTLLLLRLCASGLSLYAENVDSQAFMAFKDKDFLINELQTKVWNEAKTWQQPVQQKRITGVVNDENGQPLAGANVVIKGQARGVIADADGKFEIAVNPSESLEISFVGYETIQIPVVNRTFISIKLEPRKNELDEVTVVAYGAQKKIAITAAVSSVDVEELQVSYSPNVANALAGRVAGLTSIMRGGGQPGVDDATLYLRGVATTNGSNPLILIDGVPRDNIRTLDVSEIESISVLKDASSTSLFGVRGANGVLIITTKRGKANSKPEISVNAAQSFTRLTREPDMPGSVEYMNLRNEALKNDGFDPIFTPDIIAKFENPLAGLDPNDPDYEQKAGLSKWMYPNNDWYKMLIARWTPQTTVNANLGGGADRISYFLNVGYLHQGGEHENHAGERPALRSILPLRPVRFSRERGLQCNQMAESLR